MKTAHQASAKSVIEALAIKHHVDDGKDRYSTLAQTITHLSGDDIQLDRIERLIVSLKKQGVLSKYEALQLELRYLREQPEHKRKASA